MAGPVVITGGGTGGHVFPMQALSEALRARGLSSGEVRFVGSRRGQERQILGGGDVAMTLLPGRGLRRRWRPLDVVANARAAAGLVAAAVLALVLVRRWRPSVVVSVGGYASFATSLAALCWRTPLVLVELDATPGAAQRLVGRYARRRCRAFAAEGANVVVTGAPLRRAIEQVDRSESARARAKREASPSIGPERVTVVAMTGSLGSTRVNRAVSELATAWSSRRDRAIVHVTGRRDFDWVRSRAPDSGDLDYRVVDFADMAQLWTLCDVAVCRAGAVSVAELTALAIPSILVPLPGAPGDHQTSNARAVVRAGGAALLPDDECTGDALAALLDQLIESGSLTSMSQGAGTLGRRDAAGSIAAVIVEVRGGV